jgi:hypothetical protein
MREEAPSLDSAFEKLRRGLEHFNSIEQASDAAVKASAKAPFVEDDGDWKVVGISLGKFPIRPSIISGDMVHNLRSALDHAVWQLVKVSGGQPGSWTYFPIYGNKDDFINDVQQRAKKRGRGPLHGIEKGGPIWTLIEKYQPYKNTELPPWFKPPPADPIKWAARLTPLAILSALSRIDKHRTIHGFNVFPARGKAINDSISWNPDAILVEQRGGHPFDVLEGRAELARFRFRPGVEPNVRVTGPMFLEAGFEAEFSPGESITVLSDGIKELGESVEGILISFREFFP